MFESFIIGALASLVFSAFYFLFKKPSKKVHLYIQNAILVVLCIFCLIDLIAILTVMTEAPIVVIIINVIGIGICSFFTVKKLLNNLKLLNSNKFEE